MHHHQFQKKAYFNIAYSYLNYGIAAWRGAADNYLNKIKVRQNHIVKTITKLSLYKTKVSFTYSELSF